MQHEDRRNYIEYRRIIHEDYKKYSNPIYADTFPTFQGITSFIEDSTLGDSDVEDVIVFIALGVEAMRRNEIRSHVKRTLLYYIETNIVDKYRDILTSEEYTVMKRDLEKFRVFPPDSLVEVPDFT